MKHHVQLDISSRYTSCTVVYLITCIYMHKSSDSESEGDTFEPCTVKTTWQWEKMTVTCMCVFVCISTAACMEKATRLLDFRLICTYGSAAICDWHIRYYWPDKSIFPFPFSIYVSDPVFLEFQLPCHAWLDLRNKISWSSELNFYFLQPQW